MEHYLSTSQRTPLRAMQALEKNLKREQKMFSFFLGILVCILIISALVTLGSKVLNTLRLYEQAVWTSDESAGAVVVRRLGMLDTARFLIASHRSDLNTLRSPRIHEGICTLENSSAPVEATAALSGACNDAAGLLKANEGEAPLLIADINTGFVARHNFPSANTREKSFGANDLALLQEEYTNHFSQHFVSKNQYGNARNIAWISPPKEWNLGPHTVIAITAINDGTRIQTLLATSIELSPFSPSFVRVESQGKIAVVDNWGHVLAGNLPFSDAAALFQSVKPYADGQFKFIPPFGAAMRWNSRAIDGATIVVTVPWSELASVLHTELILGIGITALAISLLLAGGKFWRHQYIGRTYGEAKRALERQILHHLLVHASPIGLCIVRREGYQILVDNDIFRRVLKLDKDSPTLPPALTLAFAQKNLEKSADAAGDPGIRKFSFLLHVDGSDSHLEITFVPATLNGDAVYFCAIADTTKNVEAEDALRAAKAASDEVAKAKLQFFASMSHEIRTPLSSLTGNLELVSMGPLSDEQRARVHAMELSTSDLLQVVNDVLDFSKMDVGQLRLAPDWTSLTKLVTDVAVAHLPLSQQFRLKLYVITDAHLPARVKIDALRFTQVLNNIISNAFKFTKSGKIVIRALWRNDELTVTVTDSGVGIPEDLLPRLFQPFVQGDQHRLTQMRGTGLGLSICSRLMSMMGGTIDISSTVGVGSRVDIKLPFSAEDLELEPSPTLAIGPMKIALLAQATEYVDWFTQFFENNSDTVIHFARLEDRALSLQYDQLIATDEFDTSDIATIWGSEERVIWATQAGPILPTRSVQRHLQVCVYSRVGLEQALKGDNFENTEPASQSVERPPIVPEAPLEFFTGLTFLIAEDNELNLSLLKDQLRTLGVATICAKDGEEALELFDKKDVDAVITDVNMPEMNGYELLEALQSRQVELPVYAISATVQPDAVKSGRERGFTDYLTKPTPLPALAAIVQRLMTAKAALGAPPKLPPVPEPFRDPLVNQLSRDMAELPHVLHTRSLGQLEKWLHRVYGGFMPLGPSELADLCAEALEASRSSDAWDANIDALMTAVQERLMELLEQVRKPVDQDANEVTVQKA